MCLMHININVYYTAAQACPKLPSPINGQVLIRGLGTGAVATYSCTTGFSLIGSDTRVCGQDGVWQGTAPICQG